MGFIITFVTWVFLNQISGYESNQKSGLQTKVIFSLTVQITVASLLHFHVPWRARSAMKQMQIQGIFWRTYGFICGSPSRAGVKSEWNWKYSQYRLEQTKQSGMYKDSAIRRPLSLRP